MSDTKAADPADAPPLPARDDLSAAYGAWLAYLRAEKRVSDHTLEAYGAEARRFILFLADHLGGPPGLAALDELKPRDFRAFLARHRESRTNRSLARLLSSVRAFYRYLHRHHGTDMSAIAAVRAAKVPHTLPRPVSPGRAQEMIDEAGATHDEDWVQARDVAVVTLLYGAGLRISEALELNRGHAPAGTMASHPEDWRAWQALRVRGKGDKERIVPLLPVIGLALSDYLTRQPYPLTQESPLFVGIRGGRLGARQVQALVAEIRRRLGLPDRITPHALRHAFASHLLAGGADLRAIQDLLGHAHLSSTQIYTEVDTEHLLSAYQAHPGMRGHSGTDDEHQG